MINCMAEGQLIIMESTGNQLTGQAQARAQGSSVQRPTSTQLRCEARQKSSWWRAPQGQKPSGGHELSSLRSREEAGRAEEGEEGREHRMGSRSWVSLILFFVFCFWQRLGEAVSLVRYEPQKEIWGEILEDSYLCNLITNPGPKMAWLRIC